MKLIRKLFILLLLGVLGVNSAFSAEEEVQYQGLFGGGFGIPTTGYSSNTQEKIDDAGAHSSSFIAPSFVLLMGENRPRKQVIAFSYDGMSERVEGAKLNVRIDQTIVSMQVGRYFGNRISKSAYFGV